MLVACVIRLLLLQIVDEKIHKSRWTTYKGKGHVILIYDQILCLGLGSTATAVQLVVMMCARYAISS